MTVDSSIPKRMLALVKSEAKPGLTLMEVPTPTIREDEVLIKIKKSAICGTDIHIYNWDEWASRTIPVPMHVGHEFSGEIVQMGALVSGLKLGMRVSGEGHLVCGHCRNCRAGQRHLCNHTVGVGVNRPGSFANYLALKAENVFPLPEDISDEEAAIFDPLGNAVHTALSFDLVGEDVLVTGAGPIGIMGALVAQHVGARKVAITDINPFRLELARRVGVRHCFNTKEIPLGEIIKQLDMTEGFDVGLEMSGSPVALNAMIETMRPGGKIALLGILPAKCEIHLERAIWKGLWLKGIYGREMYETWYKMTAMIQSGLNVKPIITHHYPIADYEQGFQVMRSGESGKVILNWV